MEKTVSFNEWVSRIVTDFGRTGRIAVAWSIASIFKQDIEKALGCFPVLYLQGPAGVGKTALGKAITAMRGGIRMNYVNDTKRNIILAATEYPVVMLDGHIQHVQDKISELCYNPGYDAALIVAGQEFPNSRQMQLGITLMLNKRWAGDPFQIMDYTESMDPYTLNHRPKLQAAKLYQYWREAVSHIPGEPRIRLNAAIIPAAFRALEWTGPEPFSYDELLDDCIESVKDVRSALKGLS